MLGFLQHFAPVIIFTVLVLFDWKVVLEEDAFRVQELWVILLGLVKLPLSFLDRCNVLERHRSLRVAFFESLAHFSYPKQCFFHLLSVSSFYTIIVALYIFVF